MKKTSLKLLFLSIICLLSITCYCQEELSKIEKGYVLTYKITENQVSYNYIATVIEMDENGQIAVKWKTTEKKARNGNFTMAYANLENATSLVTKIVDGKESLSADDNRIFLSEPMTSDIIQYHLSKFTVDGKEHSFLFVSTKPEEKEILYNDKKIKIDYNYGEDDGVNIGIINLDDLKLLGDFSYKNYSVELVSVKGGK